MYWKRTHFFQQKCLKNRLLRDQIIQFSPRAYDRKKNRIILLTLHRTKLILAMETISYQQGIINMSFFDFFRKQTPFEKALNNSSILNSSPTVDLNDVKMLLQGFPKSDDDQLVQSMTIVQIFKEFVRLIPSNPQPLIKLKIIITCSVLLGDLKYGRLFAPQFLLWQGWKSDGIPVISKHKPVAKDVLVKFIHSYQCIIQKIAINQDLLMKSKIQQGGTLLCIDTNYTVKNFSTSVMQLYKVVNLLNYIYTFKEMFEIAALTQTLLSVMESYLLVWNDTIALYLFFERFILQFLDCYQQLDPKDSVMAYELFRDFIVSSERIKEFFCLSTKFHQPTNLKEPRLQIIKSIDGPYFQKNKQRRLICTFKIQNCSLVVERRKKQFLRFQREEQFKRLTGNRTIVQPSQKNRRVRSFIKNTTRQVQVVFTTKLLKRRKLKSAETNQ